MKKVFLALMAIAAIALTGCKEKSEIIAGTVYYSTDAGDSVFVIWGHGVYAQQFMTAMNEVMSKYAETVNPNEKQIIADFRSVTNQFNNRYLFGSLRLIRKFGGETTILETYSLQTQPKFYIYDYSKVQGNNLEAFQQVVMSKVAELDKVDTEGKLTDEAVKEAMQTIYKEYNQNALLSGDFVVSYYDGKEDKNVATYTFVPKPIYRVRNFKLGNIVCVKGYHLTNPFRTPLAGVTDDDAALRVADSVVSAINHTYYSTAKDSAIIVSKSTDAGNTYKEFSRYTVERANYIIGMDSTNLRSEEYPTVANTVFVKMQDSLVSFAKQGLVYDKANLEKIETCMRGIAKSYKQDGFYPDLEGSITLFGLKSDDSQETLATIDLSNL